MNTNKEMAVRFTQIRKDTGLTQAEYAEKLGISRPSIANLELGNSNFTERNIKTICKTFNISENWFKTGQGSMNDLSSTSTELKNDNEKELIRLFRKLTYGTKQTVLEIVRKFALADTISNETIEKNTPSYEESDKKDVRKGA